MIDPRLDVVWRRIERHAGETFRQIRGKEFTYAVNGGMIRLHTTNRSIPKGDIGKALSRLPFPSTTVLQDLQAPSYVYAILMDGRIRESDW